MPNPEINGAILGGGNCWMFKKVFENVSAFSFHKGCLPNRFSNIDLYDLKYFRGGNNKIFKDNKNKILQHLSDSFFLKSFVNYENFSK